MEKCKICGTKKFMEGTCTKKVTCEDLKLIYNNGKPLDYPKEKDTSGSPLNLSDKRELKKYGMSWIYPENDVKQFIKDLKKEMCKYVICKPEDKCTNCDKIDKIFGKELI